jgi:CheY-like chemotaxis protein
VVVIKNASLASRSVEPWFLVVDGSSGTAGDLVLILRDRGCRVEVARSGSEALAKMAEMLFDCVLSDVHTPGMSGVDLCRAAKIRCPSTRVLLMTAYAEDSLVHAAWEHGATAVLQKPLDVDRLLDFLSALGWSRKTARRRFAGCGQRDSLPPPGAPPKVG